MQAKAVGSGAGCDDEERAAQPPEGDCLCTNSTRSSSSATSSVVTMALLYCRPPILSNRTQRTAVADAIGCDHVRCGSGIGQLEVQAMDGRTDRNCHHSKCVRPKFFGH